MVVPPDYLVEVYAMNLYTKIYLTSIAAFILMGELLAYDCLNNWWLPFWYYNAIIFLIIDGVWLFVGLIMGAEEFFDQ